MKKASLKLLLLLASCTQAFSQERPDSLTYKNSVRVDLIPMYHVFFDNRVQIRAGIEYERHLHKNTTLSFYLDGGLYDKYIFTKYFDFFNQNQGIYFTEQKTVVSGLHMIPAYNYYFFSLRKNIKERLFASAAMDFGYYFKKTDHFNSLTEEKYAEAYQQAKTGIGLGIGFKNYYSKKVFIELKTSLYAKLFTYLSEAERNPIKSLDAQWTSPDHTFWWISNLKIGYAF